MVIIEPASAPEDIGKAKQVPHLFVWGDYIENSPTWVSYRERADAYAAALVKAGGVVETLDLPANGIPGNSHVPMMDVNSDHVADLVRAWIDRIR